MSLDHGILNVPLSKRGDINAQIDRYKADKAREAKETARRHHAERQAQWALVREAKTAIAAMTPEQVAGLADGFNVPARSVKKRLRDNANRWPARVIEILAAVKA